MRDDLQAYVTQHLGDPAVVLVPDETGFLKKGWHANIQARRAGSRTARLAYSLAIIKG